jgi:rubredoxin
MKCSFCEQPLVCKSCRRPFHPRKGETHLGAYQPDTQVACPECQKVLTCAACGYVYGEDEGKEDEGK